MRRRSSRITQRRILSRRSIPAPRERFAFDDLDSTTRDYMLREFISEHQGGNPYLSPRLSREGLAAWVPLMEIAIREGDEQSLAESLRDPTYWVMFEMTRKGPRNLPWDKHYQLAVTEFNTIYVRGLSRLLLDEGEVYCEVYRAAPARDDRPECARLEGNLLLLDDVYSGHRARYWPDPGDPTAFSIPTGPNCHHTIRRIRKDHDTSNKHANSRIPM